MRLHNQQTLFLYLLFIGLLLPYLTTAQISFKEAAMDKNVDHRILNGTIGGGVSVYDFNQDGLDDLTLATERGQLMGFYVNTGTSFEAMPALVDNREEVKQILWADYDNDGDADLFISAYLGKSYLYENQGNLQFVDITQSSGLPLDRHAAYGTNWGDYNRDGWIDLLCTYHNFAGAQTGGNSLFRNNADGTFTEVTENAGMGNKDRVPFAAAFMDFNNDQWPDIYTANDKLTYNTLYENLGNGKFHDASRETVTDARMNAMCVNAADINQDGWVDIYVTNTFVGGQLLQNSGPNPDTLDISFENRAPDLGIAYENGNGWGSTFFDADNDGDLDLYMCGSSSNPVVKGVHFYENIDKQHFEIITQGFEVDTFSSFSNAIGDFDENGTMDIIVQNNPPTHFHLWDNLTENNNHWVKIQLEGVLSNRDGIGTRIETYAADLYQSKFTHCGFGFLGQNTNKKHIGLGTHETLDSLILTWPSGHIDRFYNLATNQLYQILEGESTNNEIFIASDVSIIARPTITSIETIPSSATIQLMPNPVYDQLTIQADFPIDHLVISTLDGKELQQVSLENSDQYTLEVSHFKAGVYLLKIQDLDGRTKVEKWVKM